jgi:hypothetical protein
MLLWLCQFPPAALSCIMLGNINTLFFHVPLSSAGLGMLAQNWQSDDAVPELFTISKPTPNVGSSS